MRLLKASEYIILSACEAIRRAISENGGGEVFFIGRVDAGRMIVDVEPHAYGGKNAVPVLMRLVEYGDVVLHNHPDGSLEPSASDIDAASALGDLGVGSFIIDNDCKNVHIIVPAFFEEGIKPLSLDEILAYFSPSGAVAKNLEEYEHRPQQLSMAEAVVSAFNDDMIAIIEAGTGTGKSLAYLIPAITWSLQNKERVVVSTNTINLQEQLLNKDLPFLRDKAGLQFRSELMKGRQNYLCLRRAEYVRKESLWLESPKDKEIFQGIFDWAEKTDDGSLSDLNVRPPEQIWERLCCEPETCLRIRCNRYEDCFFYRARRRAARADILIVNHHLLMADLALRQTTGNYTGSSVLPPFQRIIFDEAHHVEDVATSYFTIRVSRWGIIFSLGRLSSRSPDRREKGLLHVLARKLFEFHAENPAYIPEKMVRAVREDLINDVHNVSALVDVEFEKVMQRFLFFADEIGGGDGEGLQMRITPREMETDFWRDDVADFIRRISAALSPLASSLKALLKDLEGLPDKCKKEMLDSAIEISATCERIELIAYNLNFFFNTEEGYCRWLDYKPGKRGRADSLTFCIAPIDVRDDMRQAVYNVNRTIVMTSATLTVQNSFDFMLDILGLNYSGKKGETSGKGKFRLAPPEERLLTLGLGTPFQFEKQAFVGVLTDVPEPGEPDFADAIESAIMKAVNISKGGALVLFTSYRLMDKLYERLSPLIQQMGLACMCQGEEPRHKLLVRFKRIGDAVLFATSSFWEGIDVKGEALRCLLLTRLPFRVPTEPLLQARAEAVEKGGRDPFLELDLPMAVLRFKQGFGRLIRSRTDRGAVLIFDRRVVTKNYGQAFLKSLPTIVIHNLPAKDLFDKMKEFFARK